MNDYEVSQFLVSLSLSLSSSLILRREMNRSFEMRKRYVVQSHVCDLVRHSSGPGIARRTSRRFCGNEPWGHNKTASKQREQAEREEMRNEGGKKGKGYRGERKDPSLHRYRKRLGQNGVRRLRRGDPRRT